MCVGGGGEVCRVLGGECSRASSSCRQVPLVGAPPVIRTYATLMLVNANPRGNTSEP